VAYARTKLRILNKNGVARSAPNFHSRGCQKIVM